MVPLVVWQQKLPSDELPLQHRQEIGERMMHYAVPKRRGGDQRRLGS